MRAIVVHGGCGNEEIVDKKMKSMKTGVKKACKLGFEILNKETENKDSALKAVEETIKYLEDNPVFDAGTGSFYNLLEEIEMDASIMNSKQEAGAVACIKKVQHPISIARKVMEELPHILLAGEGAQLFARSLDFAEYDPGRPEQKEDLNEKAKDLSKNMKKFREQYRKIRENQKIFSTVGVVAIDDNGEIVSGTSTGGIHLKLPGRVGDTPIIGAGTYVDKNGGASATGMGEGIIKISVTRKVIELINEGYQVQKACDKIINKADQMDVVCGVIAIDKKGNIGISHNGEHMPVYSMNYEQS